MGRIIKMKEGRKEGRKEEQKEEREEGQMEGRKGGRTDGRKEKNTERKVGLEHTPLRAGSGPRAACLTPLPYNTVVQKEINLCYQLPD